MRHACTPILIVSAALLGLASSPASAVTDDLVAHTSVSGLTFTLTDLDAGDGVAPSLSFATLSDSLLSVAGTSSVPAGGGSQQQILTSLFAPASVSVPTAFVNASGSIGGDVYSGTGSIVLTAGGSSDAQTAQAFANLHVGVAAFTLSAQTTLTISGLYDIHIDSTDPNEYSGAMTGLSLSVSGQVDQGRSPVSDSFADVFNLEPHSTTSPASGPFSITFSNPYDSAATGTLAIDAYANINTGINFAPPSDAPEPASPALMLAGLAVAASAGRRGIRHAVPPRRIR